MTAPTAPAIESADAEKSETGRPEAVRGDLSAGARSHDAHAGDAADAAINERYKSSKETQEIPG